MQKTEGMITENFGDYSVENTLFTYDAKEQEEIKLARKIYEQEMGKLEYFTFYQIQLENGMSESQAIIYNFIDGYTKTNRDFFYSNETIGEKLKWGKDKINNTIKELEKEGYIVVKKRVRAGGGTNRFIKTTGKGTPELQIRKNRIGEIWKTELDNSEKPTRVIYNNNIDYNNYYINNTEQSSEHLNNSLSLNKNGVLEEKEKSSAKKEKEITAEINDLINQIKNVCDELGVAYNKDMERQFSKHILTAKEYGEFCEKIGQTRVEFALNVLRVSVAIKYFRGALSGPKSIYKNYAELYNQAKSKMQKTFAPTINVL